MPITPTINPLWWSHLLPAGMHNRLREVEKLLRTWCGSTDGARWLDVAIREDGVFRAKPGDAIPVVDFVALGSNPVFLGKPWPVRNGHRWVGSGDLQSGHPAAPDELVLQPMLRVELVTDPALLDPARLEAARNGHAEARVSDVTQPSILVTVPAHLLLAPKSWPKRSFVLYQHIFGEGPSYPDDGYFYVGVTTRSWQARWLEHQRAMASGSPLLFHRKLREELAATRVTYMHHKVMGTTDDVEALYNSEEFLVAGHWEDKRRLNMIPGGKSGLKYLREHGMLPERIVPMPDERDRMLADWIRQHPRAGLPAPWVSERWKDPDWAVAQICGRDGRLSVEQVRAIRELSAGYDVGEIARRIGALNAAQVQRVIENKTYTRVI